jgi:iron complex outermembrane recepter protein
MRATRFYLLAILFACSIDSSAQLQSDTVRYELQPIVVTATRISEPWLGVPMALNVIDVKQTSLGRGYGLDEILGSVPGVLAQSRYGNQDVRLTIRGFGARGAGARSNSGTTRGIRVLVDGFPETEPDGRTSLDLIDFEGADVVEVVRSNASSVWGNASGGVLNVRSNTAFDAPFMNAQASMGSFGFHREAIRAGADVGPGSLFFSMSNTNFDGWRQHSSSSQTLLNSGVLSPLGERSTLGVFLSATSNIFRIPGPLTRAVYETAPQASDSTFVSRDERRNNRLGRLGATFSHELSDAQEFTASVFVSPKVLQRSERNRFRDFTRYHIGGNATYRNHLAFADDARNTLLIGVDEAYQDGAILFYDLVNGARGTTIAADKREGANNFGAFVQDELSIGERVILLTGVRYDGITYYYDDYLAPNLNDARSFRRVTPKVGITYRLSPTHSLYANVGGGVEVPAGNEVDPAPTFGDDTVRAINPLLEPITSTTAELGTKHVLTIEGGWLSGTVTYDVALYWIDVRNDIIPYSGGAYYFTAGRTRRAGIEIGARVHLDNGFSADLGVTGSRNTYVDYTIDSVHYGSPGKYRDLSGNTMSGVPQLFFGINLSYSPTWFPPALVRLSVQGVGNYFADDANQYTVPSYTVINAAAGLNKLRIAGSPLAITALLTVNNVTDAKYAASAWINPDLVNGQPAYLEPGLPRNIVATVALGWVF